MARLQLPTMLDGRLAEAVDAEVVAGEAEPYAHHVALALHLGAVLVRFVVFLAHARKDEDGIVTEAIRRGDDRFYIGDLTACVGGSVHAFRMRFLHAEIPTVGGHDEDFLAQ